MQFKKSHSSWGASGIARRDIRHDKSPAMPRVKRSGILHAPAPVDDDEEHDTTLRRVRKRAFKTPIHNHERSAHVHEWTEHAHGPQLHPLGWGDMYEYYAGYRYRTCECGARRRKTRFDHVLTELGRDGVRIHYSCSCGERFWWKPGLSPHCISDYKPGRYGSRIITLRAGDKPREALRRRGWGW